ncbi:MAG: c-type cytochrome [Pseudochelatococcus sp.]|jgi:cytochrome c|uniref:c-type cytochrome n=1 Tax=Pseudochelatococcus sp. TaxID=2020869 RepID=UPI003D8E413B
MDSFELNKIAGGVLGALLFAMSLSVMSGIIFSPTIPVIPGYDLPGTDDAGGGSAGTAVAAVAPIAVRLASADPARGEKAVAKCKACHNFVEGAGAKVGPDLYNIVNRAIGTVEGFGYSAPMKAHADAGDKWNYDSLDQFIHKPKDFVKGTIMAFAGVAKPEERADIIAYLRTLSHDPAPLPEPEAAPAEAAPAEAAPAQ